jgi:hypothetical protein
MIELKQPYFGIKLDCEFMIKVKNVITNWDKYLDECDRNDIDDLAFLDLWSLAQAALKEITGIEFHFSRTDEHYGICTEDGQEFLLKFERE